MFRLFGHVYIVASGVGRLGRRRTHGDTLLAIYRLYGIVIRFKIRHLIVFERNVPYYSLECSIVMIEY